MQDCKTQTTETVELKNLFGTVVEGGYCVGCGACASVVDSPIQMKLDEQGKLQATLDASSSSSPTHSVQEVCPFSQESVNEDELGKELFGETCTHHSKIGYSLANYAGYVTEGDFRDRGSSGGMGTWIVTALLNEGLIDGVIHIQQRYPSDADSRLFQYQLSTTLEQVRNGAKSRYYPIEMSQVVQLVRERPGRYAFVGIPCFVKAVRLLMRQDPILAERIHFCIGLICGHLKSTRFAELLAWQTGIEPDQLVAIDFRKKLPDAPASRYGIEATGKQNDQMISRISPVHEMYGTDWGLGFFKYKACDYCDDVVAETADVCVGDAWLPQYVNDSQGTNVVVVRHPIIHTLIEKARAEGRLHLDVIDADEIAKSQSSGFDHRHDGLAYRLHQTDLEGKWHPPKRIQAAAQRFNKKFREKHEMRILLAQQSHLAFQEARQAGNFAVFTQQMQPLVQKYRALYKLPVWKQVTRYLKRSVIKPVVYYLLGKRK